MLQGKNIQHETKDLVDNILIIGVSSVYLRQTGREIKNVEFCGHLKKIKDGLN